ncbi:hypothetical protein SEA_STARK_2 [Mycobacterium phage Stark]|uniref:Uncharacterized protein n=1 Tax=Mycobacterium phage Stark TaxID=2656606 RepID=A0A649VJU9_9CAUD|nr:hypothetical protein SEA_STARK_2 [Mycobacterium phage Stark]
MSALTPGTVITDPRKHGLPDFCEGCTVMGAIREDEPAVKTWGKGTGTVSWPVDDEELRWASNLAEFVAKRLAEMLGVKLDPAIFRGRESLNDGHKLQ